MEQQVEILRSEERKGNLLDQFKLGEDVTELAVVEDLWYFVKGRTGAWIAGSGHG